MQDWPLPEQTKVYMMSSTSGTNGNFNYNGGQAAWKALAKDKKAYEARNWPGPFEEFKPKCY